MPAGSILAPHYKQSNPGACLPACVRMVLASLGDDRSEKEIASILGSYEYGTPASRVNRLKRKAYQVLFGSFTLDQLKSHLNAGLFPIVFVRADMLPWANFGGFHALVLAEIGEVDIALLDPSQDSGPTRLSVDGFLMAWEEFDSLAAVITKG